MLKIRKILPYILLGLILGSFHFCFSASNPTAFIPNKGQIIVPANIQPPIAYLNLPLANIYLHHNGLRITVTNSNDKPKIHKAFHFQGTDSQFNVRKQTFDLRFVNCQRPSEIQYLDPQPYYLNYYLTNDPDKWLTHITPYKRIILKNVYPKIDFVIYTSNESIEFDWIIHPGADPNLIKLKTDEHCSISISEKSLTLNGKNASLSLNAPVAYSKAPIYHNSKQNFETKPNSSFSGNSINSQALNCHYKKLKNNTIAFQLGAFNPQDTIIIDPILVFSTYSGSSADNFGFTATYDTAGCLYAGGIADAEFRNYPVTTGAFQTVYGGSVNGSEPVNLPCDITINKYSPDGSSLIFATFLGGNDNEYPHSLCTDHNNNLLVFGSTESKDFPIHQDSFISNTHAGGYDILITKFNFNGSQLIGSTFLGGPREDGFQSNSLGNTSTLLYNYADNYRGDINVDYDGNVYIATCTRNTSFSWLKSGFQMANSGRTDALVIALSPNLSKLRWASFFGGSSDDAAYSCRFDDSGNLFIGGGTHSANFPIKNSSKAFSPKSNGDIDGFILKLDKNNGNYKAGTHWGTDLYDQIYFIDVDLDNNVYFTGQTEGIFTRTPGTYGQDNAPQFIGKLNNNLENLEFITTFGTSNRFYANLSPSAFMVDDCYNIYFSGWGSFVGVGNIGSTQGLETTSDAHQTSTDGDDFYLLALNRDAKLLQYASYFGGDESADHVDGGTSRFDKRGIVYQSVCASCPDSPPGLNDFPTTSNSVFPQNVSVRCSNASFKLDFRLGYSIDAIFTASPILCMDRMGTFTPLNKYNAIYHWDFGDGDTSNLFNPQHVFKKTGKFLVTLNVKDPKSCNVFAQFSREINVVESPNGNFTAEISPCIKGVQFTASAKQFDSIFWDLGDGTPTIINENPISHEYQNGQTFTCSAIFKNSKTGCIDTFSLVLNDTSFKPVELKIANVFTPNTDGMNDCFKVYGLSNKCDKFELRIYNRWGERIFYTKDATECWNGRVENSGPKVPSGTYFYILDIIETSNPNYPKKINGSVNVIN